MMFPAARPKFLPSFVQLLPVVPLVKHTIERSSGAGGCGKIMVKLVRAYCDLYRCISQQIKEYLLVR